MRKLGQDIRNYDRSYYLKSPFPHNKLYFETFCMTSFRTNFFLQPFIDQLKIISIEVARWKFRQYRTVVFNRISSLATFTFIHNEHQILFSIRYWYKSIRKRQNAMSLTQLNVKNKQKMFKRCPMGRWNDYISLEWSAMCWAILKNKLNLPIPLIPKWINIV